MARYKCDNCGHEFKIKVMSKLALTSDQKCPTCESWATRYIGPDLMDREKK